MIRIVAAAVVVVGCGKRDAHAPEKDWRVVGFETNEHPAALLAADGQLAVVEPDGRVRWKLALADEAEAHSADAVADLVLVTSGSRLRALDAGDGHEHWRRTLKHRITHVWRGKKSLAVATRGNIEVIDAATGTTRWSNVVAADREYFDDGRFVFSNYSLLWAVDDETGQLLWEHRIAPYVDVDWGYSNIGAVYLHESSLVVHPDPPGSSVNLDCAGCCESCGRTPMHVFDLASGEELARPETPVVPAVHAVELGTTSDGTHYHLDSSHGGPAIVACDVLGRRRWAVPAFAATSGLAALDSSGRAVIDLVGDERRLFFVDVATGAHETSPPLRASDRFVDVSGTCALVMGTADARCIDITTGVRRWTISVGGPSTSLRALENRDVLVADGEPLALSRYDSTGRRLWRATVGGTAETTLYSDIIDPENELVIASDSGHHVVRWQSDRMAVVVTDHRVRVVDFATGANESPRL